MLPTSLDVMHLVGLADLLLWRSMVLGLGLVKPTRLGQMVAVV
jgi:hypothetical protein